MRPVYYDASVSASCGAASFRNQDTVNDLCHTRIIKTFLPLFIKSPGYWTFSLASPLHLTLTCSINSVNKNSILIEGTGTITLRRGCTAHSSTLSLPADDVLVEGPPITVTTPHLPSTFTLLADVLCTLNATCSRLIPDVPALSPLSHSQTCLRVAGLATYMLVLGLGPPSLGPPPWDLSGVIGSWYWGLLSSS